MKKNWGSSSKGISIRSFPITSLDPGTLVDQLVLTSYIKSGPNHVGDAITT